MFVGHVAQKESFCSGSHVTARARERPLSGVTPSMNVEQTLGGKYLGALLAWPTGLGRLRATQSRAPVYQEIASNVVACTATLALVRTCASVQARVFPQFTFRVEG